MKQACRLAIWVLTSVVFLASCAASSIKSELHDEADDSLSRLIAKIDANEAAYQALRDRTGTPMLTKQTAYLANSYNDSVLQALQQLVDCPELMDAVGKTGSDFIKVTEMNHVIGAYIINNLADLDKVDPAAYKAMKTNSEVNIVKAAISAKYHCNTGSIFFGKR